MNNLSMSHTATQKFTAMSRRIWITSIADCETQRKAKDSHLWQHIAYVTNTY